MRQDERGRFMRGLARAREAAYPSGEYVGQESFMTATAIRNLARQAGIGPGSTVLDVCCGVGGPGRLIAGETGCRYLGVDSSASAVRLARGLGHGPACRFEQAAVPPLPHGPWDVVLLLETVLAFADKAALVAEVVRVLGPQGRFALTLEEGRPLSRSERARMPDSDTVHLVELGTLNELLRRAGLRPTWVAECTGDHLAAAAALLAAYRDDDSWIEHHVGARALAELVAAHELWCDWLGSGRVRKYALVAVAP